jgi:hypothetical protein
MEEGETLKLYHECYRQQKRRLRATETCISFPSHEEASHPAFLRKQQESKKKRKIWQSLLGDHIIV